MLNEPLSAGAAKKLVLEILANGAVTYSRHAREEMADDDLAELDVTNVLRAGRMKMPAEFEHGSWRYRIETASMAVVIAFDSETHVIVVTAWRYKK